MAEPNIRGRWLRGVSIWRKISLNTWRTPNNPSVLGKLELDVTELLTFLAQRSKESGIKCTMTHAVTRAVAMALRRYPATNVLVRGHRLWQRDDVDIFLQVSMPRDDGSGKADLSGTVLRRVDTMRVEEIARKLAQQAEAVRQKQDGEMAQTRGLLYLLPNFAIRWAFNALGFLQYDLNLQVPSTPRDPFGSAMVTSVGMLGITEGFAPLIPFSRCPVLVLIGRVEERPAVRDGQIVVRSMCTICSTFDHRIFDGYQGGRLAGMMRRCIEDPSALDLDPNDPSLG